MAWNENTLNRYSIKLLPDELAMLILHSKRGFIDEPVVDEPQLALTSKRVMLLLPNKSQGELESKMVAVGDVQVISVRNQERPLWLLVLGLLLALVVIGVVLIIVYFLMGGTILTFWAGGQKLELNCSRAASDDAATFVAALYQARG